MNTEVLKIATRKSPLALWQAEFVADLLQQRFGVRTALVPLSTRGDEILDRSLSKVGGKGLFLKELEEALLDGRADLAVHSMKDVPADMPDGLCLAAVLERHDPRDALVGPFRTIDELPQGALVGTSSLRRQAQLMAARPDLRIESLRGNVNTRLRKLDDGAFDAIMLAKSGLDRLGIERGAPLAPEVCLPAVAQGALGIETREDADELRKLLSTLEHEITRQCVDAEREVSRLLGGSCSVPLAAYAVLEGGRMTLRSLLVSPDGKQCMRADAEGGPLDGVNLASSVVEELRGQGADAVLAELQ